MSSAAASELIGWLTFALSLLVALSVAVEEFFHFGERWRHYRRMSELLKAEGWQFLQLSGPYRTSGSHAAAFPLFAERVEACARTEREEYMASVVPETIGQEKT